MTERIRNRMHMGLTAGITEEDKVDTRNGTLNDDVMSHLRTGRERKGQWYWQWIVRRDWVWKWKERERRIAGTDWTVWTLNELLGRCSDELMNSPFRSFIWQRAEEWSFCLDWTESTRWEDNGKDFGMRSVFKWWCSELVRLFWVVVDRQWLRGRDTKFIYYSWHLCCCVGQW